MNIKEKTAKLKEKYPGAYIGPAADYLKLKDQKDLLVLTIRKSAESKIGILKNLNSIKCDLLEIKEMLNKISEIIEGNL